MTIHRPLLTTALALVLTLTAAAQDSFVVMSVKGKVEYAARKDAKNWTLLTVGTTLTARDYVRTSFASYAKLMHNNTRLLSIDQNATRHLASLVPKNAPKGKANAAGAIMQYAAEQVQRAREDKVRNTYGAVRGASPVFVALFPSSVERGGATSFRWVDDDPVPTYEVIVHDEGNAIVDRRTVTATGFTAEPGSLPLAVGGSYRWSVVRLTDGVASEQRSFRILDPATAKEIDEEVRSLERELASMNADTVTTHVIRGVSFERRGLYSDACREYLAAIRLEPEIDEYRELLRAMLASQELLVDESLLLK